MNQRNPFAGGLLPGARRKTGVAAALASAVLALGATAAQAQVTASKTYTAPPAIASPSVDNGQVAGETIQFDVSDFVGLTNPIISDVNVEVTFEKYQGPPAPSGGFCGTHGGGDPANNTGWVYMQDGSLSTFADLIGSTGGIGTVGGGPSYNPGTPYSGVQTILFDDEAASGVDPTGGPASGTFRPIGATLPFGVGLDSFDGLSATTPLTLVVEADNNLNPLCVVSFTVTITAIEAADLGNDDCTGADVVTVGRTPLDLADSTTPSPLSTCQFDPDPVDLDLWYTFTAPSTADYIFETEGPQPDTTLALFDPLGCPSLGAPLACNDDIDPATNLGSSLTFSMTVGQTVLIQVGGDSDYSGGFTETALNITEIPTSIPNDDCIDAIAAVEGPNALFFGPAVTDSPVVVCGGPSGLPERDLWYTYTASEDAFVTFDTQGSAADTVLVLWDPAECATFAGDPIDCQDDIDLFAGNDDALLSLAMTAGQTVMVQVGDWSAFGAGPTGTLLITEYPVPVNDECAGALPIASGITEINTLGALTGATQPSCGAMTNDVWYTFTANAGEAIKLVSGLTANPSPGLSASLAIWGDECGSGFPTGELACEDQLPNFTNVRTQLIAPYTGTYYLQVGAQATSTDAAGTVSLDLRIGGPVPANNDCAGAIEIGSGTTNFDATWATGPDVDPGCGFLADFGPADDVWYTVTVPANFKLQVDTIGTPVSDGDTYLALWTAEACANGFLPGDLVACSDDISGTDLQSLVSVGLQPVATQYLVQVGSFIEGQPGLVNVAIEPPAPGDFCDDPLLLSEGTTPFDNTGRPDVVTGTCTFFGNSDINNVIYYSYTPASDGLLSVDTLGSTGITDTKIGLYLPDACTTGDYSAPVICNDDASGLLSAFAVNVTGGQEYLLVVGGFGPGDFGAGTLNVSLTIPQPGDTCDLPLTLAEGANPFNNEDAVFTLDPCGLFDPATVNVVFFEFTAPAAGTLTFDTLGTDTDTVMYLLDPDACPELVILACNDGLSEFADGFLASQLVAATEAGERFLLGVGTYGDPNFGIPGDSVVNVTLESPQPGDSCDDPLVIAEGTTPFDTTDRAGSIDGTCVFFGNDTINNIVWYTYTPAEDGILSVDTNGSTGLTDSKIALFLPDACDTDDWSTPVACDDDSGDGLRSAFSVPVTGGQEYLLAIGGFGPTNRGVGQVNLSIFVPGPGDACTVALPIADGTTPFDNTGRTQSLPSLTGCTAIGSVIYYEYVVSTSGQVVVDTFGSSFDTELAALSTCPPASPVLACNDDTGGAQSEIKFFAEAGDTVYIVVGGWNTTEQGAGVVNIRVDPAPPGTFCSDPLVAVLGSQSHTTLTAMLDYPAAANCVTLNNVLHYVWTAPCDGTATANTFDSAYDTKLGIFGGDQCPSFDTAIGCNDDFPGLGLDSQVSWDVVGGQTYYILVGGFSATSAGAGVLNLSLEPAEPTVVTCPDGLDVVVCNDPEGFVFFPDYVDSACPITWNVVEYPGGIIPFGVSSITVEIFDVTGALVETCAYDIEVLGDVQEPWRLQSEALYDGTVARIDSNPAAPLQLLNSGSAMAIGDLSNGRTQKGILSFVVGDGLPEGAVITDMYVRLYRTAERGDVSTLGVLLADLMDPAVGTVEFGPEDYDSAPLVAGVGAPVPVPPSIGGGLEIYVMPEHWETVLASERAQFRVYFSTPTNGDNVSDFINVGTGENGAGNSYTPELVISYYVAGCAGCGENPEAPSGFQATESVYTTGTTDGFAAESFESAQVGGSANTTSKVMLVGDGRQDNQHVMILGFDTGSLAIPADASIDSVSLVLSQSGSVRGDVTELGDLLVDMRCLAHGPWYGTGIEVEAQDFQGFSLYEAVGVLEQVPDTFQWAAELSPVVHGSINRAGYTQLKVRFAVEDNNNLSQDTLSFWASENTSVTTWPTLVVTYTVPGGSTAGDGTLSVITAPGEFVAPVRGGRE